METFAKLFERFLVFVYHCFDRIVIQGYLPLLTRPEHMDDDVGERGGEEKDCERSSDPLCCVATIRHSAPHSSR